MLTAYAKIFHQIFIAWKMDFKKNIKGESKAINQMLQKGKKLLLH